MLVIFTKSCFEVQIVVQTSTLWESQLIWKRSESDVLGFPFLWSKALIMHNLHPAHSLWRRPSDQDVYTLLSQVYGYLKFLQMKTLICISPMYTKFCFETQIVMHTSTICDSLIWIQPEWDTLALSLIVFEHLNDQFHSAIELVLNMLLLFTALSVLCIPCQSYGKNGLDTP